MVKVNYNAATGEIKGFYPDDIGYASIPEPSIEIDETTHRDCINNPGLRLVDLTTFEIVEYTPPCATLEEEKAAAWKNIKAERNRREQAGVPYLGKVIDSDPTSVQRISIAVQAAQAAIGAGQDLSLDWTCQDNSVLTMTAEQVVGMSVVLAQYSTGLHQIARELREQIEAATTAEEVQAVKWPDT